jgi:diacylglycerol kinase family enzyme/membrane-associated phospholipid phosphatase
MSATTVTRTLTARVRRLGVGRRWLRGLVPAPIRAVDLAAFRAVARLNIPVLGPILPVLSRAANHSRLWLVIAVVLESSRRRSSRRAALRGLLSIGITSAVTNLPAKLVTGRNRPVIDPAPTARRLARVPRSTSFPSGHAASAFAFATGVAIEEPRLRAPILGLASAVAFSRVYSGVHYPADVLAGAAIGIAVARATTRNWLPPDPPPATAELAADGAGHPEGQGLLVVANVGAGNRLGEREADRLRALLPEVEIVETRPGDDLPTTLQRAAERAEILGVAGGDGSASAGATVAAERGLPLAVVPTGTMNHLAADLGVASVDDVARAVRAGRTIVMDVAEIGGRPFVNMAAVGAYPWFVTERDRLEGRFGWWLATVFAAVRTIATSRPLEVQIDGRARRVWLLYLGNGRYAAPGPTPVRRLELDAGHIDVRLTHAESSWSRLRLLGGLLVGRPERSGVCERWTAQELTIRSSDGPLELIADGETWQGPPVVHVGLRRRALRVLQPEPRESS